MAQKHAKKLHQDMERALHDDDPEEGKLFSKEEKGTQSEPLNISLAKSLHLRNVPFTIESMPIHGLPEPYVSLNRFYKMKLYSYLSEATENELRDLSQICGYDISLYLPDHPLFNVNAEHANPPVVETLEANHSSCKAELECPSEQTLKSNDLNKKEKDLHNAKILASNANALKEPASKFVKRKKSKKTKKSKKSANTFNSDNYVLPPPGFSSIAASIYRRAINVNNEETAQKHLVPGTDVLITIRMYNRFDYKSYKKNTAGALKDLFYHDVVLTGRHKVLDIMEHFICSENGNCKDMANGFLFIKNVFYVNKNQEATDHANSIRFWCEAHNLGNFPLNDMSSCILDQLDYKLGHPDVYIHNTTCEHVVIFSQIRLLDSRDPPLITNYPRIASIAYNKNTAFCYNCSALYPHWIVSGCSRIPFNMALYCNKCYKSMLFDENDQQVCEFKSFPYRGLNVSYN